MDPSESEMWLEWITKKEKKKLIDIGFFSFHGYGKNGLFSKDLDILINVC